MGKPKKSDKRRKQDAASRAKALGLAEQNRSTQAVTRVLNSNPKLLYPWQQAPIVAEAGSEALARDPEMRALRAANKRLVQELEMLKKSSPPKCYKHIFSSTPGPRSCYAFIAAEQLPYPVQPVQALGRTLALAASSYYAGQQAQRASFPEAATCFDEIVKEVFHHHKRHHGTRRLRAKLQSHDQLAGLQCLRTAMRRQGQRALQPKSYVPRTTDSTHGQRTYCSTSRRLPALIRCGSPTSPTCHWSAGSEPSSALFRLALRVRQWAGR